jgi:hypothetical protein
VQLSLDTFVPSDVTVHGLLVERAGEAGVVVAGSSLVGEGIEVRDSQAVGGHSRGIQIQTFPSAPSVATTAELRSVLITDIDEVGVFAIGAELTLSSFVITNTVATAEGKFGDGLAILGHEGIGQADLRHGRVDDSARAALGVFGAVAEIVNLRMRCQAFDIAVDAYEGVLSTLTDGGDNTCGCGAEIRDCKALSSGLEPPEPI